MNIADSRRTITAVIPPRRASLAVGLLLALLLACSCLAPAAARASSAGPVIAAVAGGAGGGGEDKLEKAAQAASKTGEKVAMSMIGLALAIAAIVLAFRRDFKEAAGVLVIAVIAIFLADAGIGVKVISETVKKLFGA